MSSNSKARNSYWDVDEETGEPVYYAPSPPAKRRRTHKRLRNTDNTGEQDRQTQRQRTALGMMSAWGLGEPAARESGKASPMEDMSLPNAARALRSLRLAGGSVADSPMGPAAWFPRQREGPAWFPGGSSARRGNSDDWDAAAQDASTFVYPGEPVYAAGAESPEPGGIEESEEEEPSSNGASSDADDETSPPGGFARRLRASDMFSPGDLVPYEF